MFVFISLLFLTGKTALAETSLDGFEPGAATDKITINDIQGNPVSIGWIKAPGTGAASKVVIPDYRQGTKIWLTGGNALGAGLIVDDKLVEQPNYLTTSLLNQAMDITYGKNTETNQLVVRFAYKDYVINIIQTLNAEDLSNTIEYVIQNNTANSQKIGLIQIANIQVGLGSVPITPTNNFKSIFMNYNAANRFSLDISTFESWSAGSSSTMKTAPLNSYTPNTEEGSGWETGIQTPGATALELNKAVSIGDSAISLKTLGKQVEPGGTVSFKQRARYVIGAPNLTLTTPTAVTSSEDVQIKGTIKDSSSSNYSLYMKNATTGKEVKLEDFVGCLPLGKETTFDTTIKMKDLNYDLNNISIYVKNELGISSTGITIKITRTLPEEYDWGKLNTDGLDLSTFTKVDKNTPVKLTGGAFDTKERDYYLFFGSVGSSSYTYATDTFSTSVDMNAPLGLSKELSLLNPSMIGVQKQQGAATKTSLFSYNNTNTKFDIGQVDLESEQITVNSLAAQPKSSYISQQYIKGNEIVSYGYVALTTTNKQGPIVDYQPIRVHGYVTDKAQGKIKYDVSFLNEEAETKYVALNYGGAKKTSSNNLVSSGEDGVYIENLTTTSGWSDAKWRVRFHMAGKNYPEKDGPTSLKTGSATSTNWASIGSQGWTNKIVGYTDPYETWDSFGSSDVIYKSASSFAYRWEPIEVKSGAVGRGSLTLSIDEPGSLPTDYDWTKLNTDGVDLSTFEEVDKNTPVKLTGGVFDERKRDYYMFFGHVGASNKYTYATNTFNAIGNMYAPLGTTTNLPLLAPMMIGVKKQTDVASKSIPILGYDYNYSTSSAGETEATFNISNSSNLPTGEISRQVSEGKTYIIKQYVKKNEIISYGFVMKSRMTVSGEVDVQPVRVHGYIKDKSKGLINYDVSFLNEQIDTAKYAVTYGVHVDIGGNHKLSKLYSNGSDGLYFNEPKANNDGLPVQIYFHMNDSEKGPTSFKTGNLGRQKVDDWKNMKLNFPNLKGGYTDPYEPWDTPSEAGSLYKLAHPIFAFRWDPISVKSGEVGTATQTLSLEERGSTFPVAEKTYKNLTTKDEKNHPGDTLEFQLTAKNNSESESWNGVSITDVLPKGLEVDSSSFRLVDKNGQESSLPSSIYDEATRTIKTGKYDLSAGNKYQLKFQAKIGDTTTEEIVNSMTAASDEVNSASSSVTIPVVGGATILVNFVDEVGKDLHAKVPITGNIGSTVDLTKQEAVSEAITAVLGKHYQLTQRPSNETAVPVVAGDSTVQYVFNGTLSIVTAPELLDFGSIEYKAQKERVDDPSYAQPLAVSDTRADKAQGWTLTATLTAPMKNSNNQTLANALRYVYKGEEKILDTNAQVVYNTTTAQEDNYTVSDTWGTKKGTDGVKLQIGSTDTVYKGTYTGVITWKVMAGQP